MTQPAVHCTFVDTRSWRAGGVPEDTCAACKPETGLVVEGQYATNLLSLTDSDIRPTLYSLTFARCRHHTLLTITVKSLLVVWSCDIHKLQSSVVQLYANDLDTQLYALYTQCADTWALGWYHSYNLLRICSVMDRRTVEEPVLAVAHGQ